jgi:hypothetical protein
MAADWMWSAEYEVPATPDEPPLTFPESRCPGEPGQEG